MVRPLEGIKVLDLTRLLPGAVCTMLLRQLGAEVVKLEEPGKGDYMRGFKPLFNALNRGKKSVSINLGSKAGREIAEALLRESRVLVESFRPGVMARFGLSYEEMSAMNPSIVYCSITGYGQSGAMSSLPGHDINYAGIAGLLAPELSEDNAPRCMPTQVPDIGGGVIAALQIVSHLLLSKTQGRGAYIDLSMTDVALLFNLVNVASAAVGRTSFEDSPFSGSRPFYNIYRTRDGRWLSLAALEQKFWEQFCTAFGRKDLNERQFSSGEERVKTMEEVSRIFSSEQAEELLRVLRRKEIPAAQVNSLDEIFKDEYFKERGSLLKSGEEIAIDVLRTGRDKRLPLRKAPALGEHTISTLRRLGYGYQELKALSAKGVICYQRW